MVNAYAQVIFSETDLLSLTDTFHSETPIGVLMCSVGLLEIAKPTS